MKTILVIYHSQEKGNTRKMAELVAEGCRQVKGVVVRLINVNEQRVDMKEAENADAYALGSPDYFSYIAGNLKQFFDDILLASWRGMNTINKPYVGFITHGGGGSAVKSLENLARETKLIQVAPSLVCAGAPQRKKDMEQSVELGNKLAMYITA
jgi:multimeric flavodoxin WrbA